MTIREELIKKGFSNTEINIFLTNEYSRQKQKLHQEKERLIELKKQLGFNFIEKYIPKLISQKSKEKLFDETTNSIEIINLENIESIKFYEYCNKSNIKPTEIIENIDGTISYIYRQKDKIIKMNIQKYMSDTKFSSKEEKEEFELNNKRLLSELLPVSEKRIVNMSEKQILRLVYKREKKRNMKNR